MQAPVLGDVRVFRDTGATLIESPWWRDGTLYWTDIPRGELHVSPETGAADGSDDTVLLLPPPLASFHPAALPGGGSGYIAALGDRVVLVALDGTIVTDLAHIAHPVEGMRMNEGKVDPQGRFVVGSLNLANEDGDGSWYRVGPGGAETLCGGFSITNALEWTLDEDAVFLADTPATTIYRATWDPGSGPGELQVFAQGHRFDGAVIDEEGCLWSAVYGEGRVVRLSPEGEEIGAIALPAPNPAGICFGGDDLRTLFIGMASENLTPEQLRRHPTSGGILSVETAVRGLPIREYRP